MSGPIAQFRADAAAEIVVAMGSDVKVHPAMPERITPPCVVLAERSPLVDPDDSAVGGARVHLEAVIFVAGMGSTSVRHLDNLTDRLIAGMWDNLPTASYGTITLADGATYLIARIPLDSDPYKITD